MNQNVFQLCEIGTAHLKRKGGVNQDHHAIDKITDDGKLIVAAIADGMGSCIHADEGSKLCSTVCTRRIATSLRYKAGEISDEIIIQAIKDGFNAAWGATASKDEPAQYLSTLIALVADIRSGLCWYGYVGDGGLIAASQNGSTATFKKLERRQKGEAWNVTFPTYIDKWPPEEIWRFGKSTFDVLAAFTDGSYDAICDNEWPDPNLNEQGKAFLAQALEGRLSAQAFDAAFPKDAACWKATSIAKRCTDDRTALLIVSDRALKRGRQANMQKLSEVAVEKYLADMGKQHAMGGFLGWQMRTSWAPPIKDTQASTRFRAGTING